MRCAWDRAFEWLAFDSNREVAALARDLHDCRRVHEDGVIKWYATIS
jgi:hypothetical protein